MARRSAFSPINPERPSQFLQTGVECLGVANREGADSEILNLAVEGVRAAGLEDFSIQIGDLALFAGLVDALDIPAQWRGRLKRHFWRPDYFRELLARLSNGASVPGERYLAHLGSAGEDEARAALSGLMDYLGGAQQGTVLGGRTREEIVERLMEQAAEAAAIRLDTKAVALIERVLSVSGPALKSVTAIRTLLKKNGIKLDAPLGADGIAHCRACEAGPFREAREFRRPLRPQHGILHRLRVRAVVARRRRVRSRSRAADATTRCCGRWGRRRTSRRRLRHPQRAGAGRAPRHGSALTWPPLSF